MDADFYKACVPEPVQIFGVHLLPFSLGHYTLLARFKSGWLEGQPKDHDLIFGLVVCSQTFGEGLAYLASPDYEDNIEQWSRKLHAKAKSEGVTLDFDKAILLFADYLKSGMFVPSYSVETKVTEAGEVKKASPIGAHWSLMLKVSLMSDLGYSEEQALNKYLPAAWYEYLAWREINGKGVRLVDKPTLESKQKIADEAHATNMLDIMKRGKEAWLRDLLAAANAQRKGKK